MLDIIILTSVIGTGILLVSLILWYYIFIVNKMDKLDE